MEVHPLAKYREETHRTQQELAELVGVARTTVARWETGRRKVGQAILDSVAEKTGIPKRDLRPDLAEVMREAAE